MRHLVLVSTLLFSMGSLAGAEFTRGSQTAALFAGAGGSSTQYDYQVGTRRNVTGGGGAFGGQYLYYLTNVPAVALGIDLNASSNGNGRQTDLLTGIDTTARIKSFVGMVIARLAYPRGIYRPYIFAGVGGHHSSQQLSGRPAPGNTWLGGGSESRILVDEHRTSAALGYGIGLDVFPMENFFFGAELRGTWLVGLDTDDTVALRAAGFTAHSQDDISQGNVLFRVGTKF